MLTVSLGTAPQELYIPELFFGLILRDFYTLKVAHSGTIQGGQGIHVFFFLRQVGKKDHHERGNGQREPRLTSSPQEHCHADYLSPECISGIQGLEIKFLKLSPLECSHIPQVGNVLQFEGLKLHDSYMLGAEAYTNDHRE